MLGYYPKSHGGKKAYETYSIKKLSWGKASGRYDFRSGSPNIGPTGQKGVWTGSWTIFFSDNFANNLINGIDNTFRLIRVDDASGWRGSYHCRLPDNFEKLEIPQFLNNQNR